MLDQETLKMLWNRDKNMVMQSVLDAYKCQKEINFQSNGNNWLCQFTTFIKAGNVINDIQKKFLIEKLLPYVDSLTEIANGIFSIK